ncbi:membrin-11-like [Zingiber officinale]|uniref:membrin-11-like n=1 Tax=Zingiber officinale TaxID=94328 RepID=UPI001C4C536A|nr:membrin-11-like [Zingiber officinale]
MEAGGSGGGGGTLSEIYHSAQRLLLRATGGLERLERLDSSSPSSYSSYASSSSLVPSVEDPGELATEIRRDIAQIRSLCAEMKHLWRSVPSRGQRDLWKRKVEVVAEKVDSLKESLDKQLFRQQNRMLELEDRERAEFPGGANSGSAHVLRIFDEEAQAMQSARNSSMMLEEAYTTGVAVLSKYADQRDLLKRAQRKALDILNTVGLSNTVLKLIERRHSIDKWITYSGMGISFMVALAFVWSLH